MTRVDIEIHNNVVDIYNKIKDIEDSGIEIVVPKGAVLFDNTINIKLIKQLIQKDGKVLTITTEDQNGLLLMNMIEEGTLAEVMPYEQYDPKESFITRLKNIKFPMVPHIRVPKLGIIIPIVGLIVLLSGSYMFLQSVHKGNVKIVVKAQTITRSVTVSAEKGKSNDFDKNLIRGIEIQKTIQSSQTQPTTGQKTEGKKATGNITIYNKTAEAKEMKKGEVIVYEDDDIKYQYKTTSDITIPARTDDLLDPTKMTPGEANTKIEAVEIGTEYNIKKDETLELKNYKTTDFVAKAISTFEGGTKDVKKAVAQQDIDTLKATLLKQNTEDIKKELEKSSNEDTKYIKGSENITVIKEDFSEKVGDEATVVTLEQTITATALAYSTKDIDGFVNKTISSLIPEGYEISQKDKDTKVNILGNSSNSALTTDKADLQVSINMFIVPTIDTDKLKESLKGKGISEGQEIISKLNSNIKTYEVNVYPRIPIFNKFPSSVYKIEITVEKE